MAAARPETFERTVSGHTAKARVLLVSDSVVARSVIADAVAGQEGMTVADAVSRMSVALAVLAERAADIIVVGLPIGGLEDDAVVRMLGNACPGAQMLVIAPGGKGGDAFAGRIRAQVNSAVLFKPPQGLGGSFERVLRQRLAELAPTSRTGVLAAEPQTEPFEVVAIGASTGGIHALNDVLRGLPAGFAAPVLVTQHLPPTFMPFFAAQVTVATGRPCEIASDHLRLVPGHILIAPGDAHLTLVRGLQGPIIRLNREPSVSGNLPSVDPMFRSVAQVFGPGAAAVVLSGMGRDGCEGAAALAQAGGTVIAQDRASSVVWGMPGAVVRAGIAATLLPPNRIGAAIGRGRQRS